MHRHLSTRLDVSARVSLTLGSPLRSWTRPGARTQTLPRRESTSIPCAVNSVEGGLLCVYRTPFLCSAKRIIGFIPLRFCCFRYLEKTMPLKIDSKRVTSKRVVNRFVRIPVSPPPTRPTGLQSLLRSRGTPPGRGASAGAPRGHPRHGVVRGPEHRSQDQASEQEKHACTYADSCFPRAMFQIIWCRT